MSSILDPGPVDPVSRMLKLINKIVSEICKLFTNSLLAISGVF